MNEQGSTASDTPAAASPVALVTRGVLAVLLLVAGAGVFSALKSTAPEAKVSTDRQVMRVGVFEPRVVPVRRQWRGYGVAAPLDSADIPARVTAVVRTIEDGALAGQPVAKGQLLVRLDDEDFRREVEIATQHLYELEAQLKSLAIEEKKIGERLALETEDMALSEAELTRAKELRAANVATRREVDAATRDTIMARAKVLQLAEARDKIVPRRLQLLAQQKRLGSALKIAELSASRCQIRSPIAGVLQSVDVEIGENIAAGSRVARVVSLARVEVALRLPAAAQPDLRPGDPATLSSTGGLDRSWDATIARLAPVQDADGRSVTVFVEIEQAGAAARYLQDGGAGLLLPGAFVAGSARGHATHERWVVPRRAVSAGRVIAVDHGLAKSTPVEADFTIEASLPTTGLDDRQWVVLAAGTDLSGRVLLVNASRAVADGQPVEPVGASPAGTGAAP